MKKGISLVVLVISIIVTIILVSVVVVSTKKSIDDSKITSFLKDLSTIEDASVSYYLNNNEFPTDKPMLNKNTLLGLVDAKVSNNFNEELSLNSDELSDEFYEINLAKLNVTKTKMGNLKNGNNDVYVIAYPSFNIYYLKGVKIDNVTYFSMTSKLLDISKINIDNNKDNSVTIASKTGGITVNKKNGFTNKMGASIKTNINSNEILKIKIGNNVERIVTTTVGLNNISFDNISDLIPKVTGLTESDSTVFNNLTQADKNIEILKYKGSELIGNLQVKFNNFEVETPTITNAILSSYNKINTVALTLNDNISKVKEVRYEYLKRYETNGNISSFYEGKDDFDVAYMLSKGKSIKVTDNIVTISAPKEIKTLKIAVIDNAGNVTLYNQEISSRLYIGYTLSNVTLNEATITAKINSINGVKNIVISKSNDGITFDNEETFVKNTTNNGITECSKKFIGLNNNKVFIKIVVNNNTITETRVIEVKLNNTSDQNYNYIKRVNKPKLAGMTPIKIENDGTVIPTTETDANWYNYIDQGVYGTDNKTSIWANAKTNDNSQFVWIPRYAYKITTEHTSVANEIDVIFLKGTTNRYDNNGIDSTLPTGYIVHPAFTFGSDKLTGIWVAKYEASNNNGKVKIAPGVSSWRSIAVANMFDNCFTMATDPTYGFTGLTNGNTHMMKNIEWGAVAYLAHSKYGRNGNEITINNSSGYITGCAGNSVSAAENVGTTAYNTAGGYLATTTGNISGIYDMSGGSWEYVAGNLNSTLASAGSATNFNTVWNNPTEKAKYFDIYDGYNDKIKGDAVYETSRSVASPYTSSWFEDYSDFLASGHPWFGPGGYFSHGTIAGVFCFRRWHR